MHGQGCMCATAGSPGGGGISEREVGEGRVGAQAYKPQLMAR